MGVVNGKLGVVDAGTIDVDARSCTKLAVSCASTVALHRAKIQPSRNESDMLRNRKPYILIIMLKLNGCNKVCPTSSILLIIV